MNLHYPRYSNALAEATPMTPPHMTPEMTTKLKDLNKTDLFLFTIQGICITDPVNKAIRSLT